MKPWQREMGFTEEGAALADRALPFAERFVRECGNVDEGVMSRIFEEAVFRVTQLPRRSKAFQRAYAKKNG